MAVGRGPRGGHALLSLIGAFRRAGCAGRRALGQSGNTVAGRVTVEEQLVHGRTRAHEAGSSGGLGRRSPGEATDVAACIRTAGWTGKSRPEGRLLPTWSPPANARRLRADVRVKDQWLCGAAAGRRRRR